MTDENVDSVFSMYADKVPEDKRLILKNALRKADDAVYENLMGVPLKSATTTLLLAIFLGGLGIDRFYIGDVGFGVGKLLVGWLTLGIWPFVDIFFSYKRAKEKNFQKLMLLIC